MLEWTRDKRNVQTAVSGDRSYTVRRGRLCLSDSYIAIASPKKYKPFIMDEISNNEVDAKFSCEQAERHIAEAKEDAIEQHVRDAEMVSGRAYSNMNRIDIMRDQIDSAFGRIHCLESDAREAPSHRTCAVCNKLLHRCDMARANTLDSAGLPDFETICKTCIPNSKYDRRAKTKAQRVENDRRKG